MERRTKKQKKNKVCNSVSGAIWVYMLGSPFFDHLSWSNKINLSVVRTIAKIKSDSDVKKIEVKQE